MTDKNARISAITSLFLCAFLIFPAHADFLNFSKIKQEKTKKSLWSSSTSTAQKPEKGRDSLTHAESLSQEDIEKRKQENAALSAKTGVNVPELFDQKLLTASGRGPNNTEEVKTIRAIKMSKNAQALKAKRSANAQKKARKTSTTKGQNAQRPNVYLPHQGGKAKQQRKNTLFQFKKKNTRVFKNY